MTLNDHEIEGLYRLADDLQRDGHFTDATNLRELLDAWKVVDRSLYELETDDVEEIVKVAKIESSCAEKLEEVKDALETAASEAGKEAGNFDDNRISLHAEIDRLEEALQLDPAATFETAREVVEGLHEVVATLEGQRDRLKDTEKRAREALKEASR